MSIDKDTVKKVSRLARIRLTDEEMENFPGEIDGIMNWIEQLAEVDTDNVQPLTSVVDMQMQMRKDEVTDGDCRDAVLANAPETTEGFFVVPKVVE